MSELKFKIGDKIDYFQNKGVIIGVDLASPENRALDPYLVKFNNGNEFWFDEEEIEEYLIRE